MISDAMQGGDYEKALTLLKASDIDPLQIDFAMPVWTDIG